MYGILAGFSSLESIFAEINYLFPGLSPLFKKQEICQVFFPKSHYFTSIVTS